MFFGINKSVASYNKRVSNVLNTIFLLFRSAKKHFLWAASAPAEEEKHISLRDRKIRGFLVSSSHLRLTREGEMKKKRHQNEIFFCKKRRRRWSEEAKRKGAKYYDLTMWLRNVWGMSLFLAWCHVSLASQSSHLHDTLTHIKNGMFFVAWDIHSKQAAYHSTHLLCFLNIK